MKLHFAGEKEGMIEISVGSASSPLAFNLTARYACHPHEKVSVKLSYHIPQQFLTHTKVSLGISAAPPHPYPVENAGVPSYLLANNKNP